VLLGPPFKKGQSRITVPWDLVHPRSLLPTRVR
jgi:hypothetical protein